MRDTQQRLEEIRRRSKICIEKGKRRQRLLITAVSSGLCICLCLGAVFLLPGEDRAGDTLTGAAGVTMPALGRVDSAAPENAPESVDGEIGRAPEYNVGASNAGLPDYGDGFDLPEASDTGLEVVHGELVSYIMDAQVVGRVEELLAAGKFENPLEDNDLTTETQTPDCSFSLCYSGGSRSTYRLTGNRLEDTATGYCRYLTDDALLELRSLLGVK